MKIVFLDIDGVLNAFPDSHHKDDSLLFTKSALVVRMGLGGDFAPEPVANLNRITDQTGAKIVVHSTWRHTYDLGELREILSTAGVTGEIISTTPRELPGRSKVALLRGHFIQAWMDQWEGEPIERFVILDDNKGMVHLIDFLVHTNPKEGLVKWATDKAILILQGVTW